MCGRGRRRRKVFIPREWNIREGRGGGRSVERREREELERRRICLEFNLGCIDRMKRERDVEERKKE